MRKRDKLKNIEEANLMLEQTYLDSKTLFTEENTKQIIKEICVNVNKKFKEILDNYRGVTPFNVHRNRNKNLGTYLESLKSVCNRGQVDEKDIRKATNNLLHQLYYEPTGHDTKMLSWGKATVMGRFDMLLRKLTNFKMPKEEPSTGEIKTFNATLDTETAKRAQDSWDKNFYSNK